MKRIIMFVLLFAALKVAGQTTGYLRFDTVKIMKQNGYCELYIINKTKDSLGLLTNVGGGLTQFKRARAINDSMIIVGNDTLTIRGAGGGANLANSALTANGDYDHNWAQHYLSFDSVYAFKIERDARDAIFPDYNFNSFLRMDSTINQYPFRAHWSLGYTDASPDSIWWDLGSTRTSSFLYNVGASGYGLWDFIGNSTNPRLSGTLFGNSKTSNYSFGHVAQLKPADSVQLKAVPAATADSILAVRAFSSGLNTIIKIPASAIGGSGSGGGITYIYSATAPTGSDTAKIWIQTPAKMGVHDVFTYATYQFGWVRYAWLSVDGLLSFLPPVNVVLAGQSNAGGIYSGGDTARMAGILGYSTGAYSGGLDAPTQWQPVYIGLSPFYGSNNNIAHAFAKEVIRKERKIVRIIAAFEGGITIGRWNGRETFGPNTPTYLLDTLRQRLDRSGIDTVHVFLWIHGESSYPTSDVDGGYYNDFKCLEDSLYSPLTKGFYRNFTNIISCDMGTDTSTTEIWSGAGPQGAMRRLLNDNDPYTSFAAAYGLSLCDDVHLCGPALDSLGRRGYAAYKQMPRNMVDEEPKYTYDYVNDKKAFPTRISAYANGITGTNAQGLNLGWFNNSGLLFGVDGSNGVVRVGAALGYTTAVPKAFQVAGKATISDASYNTIISGYFNITGTNEHNVVIGNYPSDFSNGSGVSESVFIGYDAAHSTGIAPYNSVFVGSGAGSGITPVVAGHFITAVGKDAAKNATCGNSSFFGAKAGENAQGNTLAAFGNDAGAFDATAHVNSSAFGPNTKYNEDSAFVAGNALKRFIIGGTTSLPFLVGAPSDGDTWQWVAANSQFELLPTSGADGNGIYSDDGTLTGNRHVSGGASAHALQIDSSSSISLFSGLEYISSGIGSFIQMSDSVMSIGSSSATDFTSFIFSPTRIKFTAADGAGSAGDVWTNTGSGYGHWAAGPSSGTYTPTLTNGTNVDATVVHPFKWTRTGSIVHVSGMIEVDATSNTTPTEVGISLIIASAISNNYEITGNANCPTIGQSGSILGDATNNRASLQFLCASVGNNIMTIEFTYEIL